MVSSVGRPVIHFLGKMLPVFVVAVLLVAPALGGRLPYIVNGEDAEVGKHANHLNIRILQLGVARCD